MKRKLAYLATSGGVGALFLGLLAAAPAYAGTNTGSMQVTASVAGTCTITADPLTFGTLTLSGGNTTTTSGNTTVAYLCNTVPTAFTVGTGLYNGTGPGTSTTYAYAMQNGSSDIAYGLDVTDNSTTFTPANAANPPSTNITVGGATPTLDTATYDIAGRIPSGQAAIPGTYQDTVTFTITY